MNISFSRPYSRIKAKRFACPVKAEEHAGYRDAPVMNGARAFRKRHTSVDVPARAMGCDGVVRCHFAQAGFVHAGMYSGGGGWKVAGKCNSNFNT